MRFCEDLIGGSGKRAQHIPVSEEMSMLRLTELKSHFEFIDVISENFLTLRCNYSLRVGLPLGNRVGHTLTNRPSDWELL